MGIQVIGDQKRRRAEWETGLRIDRLVRLTNTRWEARVLSRRGHRHVWIDPRTWEHGRDPGAPCWSSCTGRHLISPWFLPQRWILRRLPSPRRRAKMRSVWERRLIRLTRALRLRPRPQ